MPDLPRGGHRTAPESPLLSVVVPTRNEAGNIGPLVERLSLALGTIDHELCFVDDSDDGTPALLDELSAVSQERIRCLLRHGAERAGGLSTAVIAGLRMARGQMVCVMDADLQHPPETIPAMLDAAQEGADLVVASRYTTGGSHSGLGGIARRLVSRGATWTAQILFHEARQSSDPLAGFFLCRRSLLDGIEFRPVGFKILLELLVCVPGLRVRDVPLGFQPRQSGESKASIRQGFLYLRHLRSLFFDVQGSARRWMFAMVGGSGLAVQLGVLALCAVVFKLPALAAFAPAFAAALAWNTWLNWLWTFADHRARANSDELTRYLRSAMLGGVLMFATYALLLKVGLPALAAGALSATLAMAVNATANWSAVRHGPAGWAEVALSGGVQAALRRLQTQLDADRAYVLPAEGTTPAAVPGELLARVVAMRRPALWVEAASYRPQRRTNIEVASMLLVPVVGNGVVLGVVVGEKRALRGFDSGDLEIATRAADSLADMLTRASDAIPTALFSTPSR